MNPLAWKGDREEKSEALERIKNGLMKKEKNEASRQRIGQHLDFSCSELARVYAKFIHRAPKLTLDVG